MTQLRYDSGWTISITERKKHLSFSSDPDDLIHTMQTHGKHRCYKSDIQNMLCSLAMTHQHCHDRDSFKEDHISH